MMIEEDSKKAKKGKEKAPKPSRFNVKTLEVGEWCYSLDGTHETANDFQVKFMYNQRKMVYEWVTDYSGTGTERRKIEVLFDDIQNIHFDFKNAEIHLMLARPPKTFAGVQARQAQNPLKPTKYEPTQDDFSNGELMKCKFHKLSVVSTAQLNKHSGTLLEFDERLKSLSQEEFPSADENSSFDVEVVDQTPVTKKRKREPTAAVSPKVKKTKDVDNCKCSSSCSSTRCACVKRGLPCYGCKCKQCKNPFSVMEKLGVDLLEATQDVCLSQNLSKVTEAKLNSCLTPSCCTKIFQIKNLIGGGVCKCGSKWSYSWCTDSLIAEDFRPRNHCSICKRCGDYRDMHCDSCNKCYFTGLSGFPCPCKQYFDPSEYSSPEVDNFLNFSFGESSGILVDI